jgi:dTDP-4-amino-4,6-dideoxygalactose transaminase
MISIASPDLREAEREAVVEVMNSDMIADGPEVRAFEDDFASFCETEYGVATANGTAALHAALEGADIGEGDTVLTTPFSFVATANVIRLSGATPVFADIDPQTYNLDPASVREAVEERNIDAMIVVHLYGLPAAMDELQSIAEEYDLTVIEDAAQAHGAEYRGRRVGGFGDAACFSFYPTKNMTTAEGGMVVTDDETLAERTRQFINHGRTGKYDHEMVGHNLRMTSINAAIGRV